MTDNIKTPKKLIEVALPLDDINAAAAREKSIRHGHPSTLHLWWARRPLAAARAVIFAQMVNDPGYQQGGGFKYGVNKEKAAIEREKLFDIIRDLVKWENTNNEDVLNRAREAIKKSWRETCALNKDHPQAAELFNPDQLPAFHDPFAGGGALPLEAQRLGLEAYASDLNPVAVMINKAMIEIPPKFAGCKPVGPIPEADKQDKKRATSDAFEDWSGAKGLAEDVRRYGHWMREEAFKRIGHLYPQVEITEELAKDRDDLKGLVGEKLTVIAWLWARTVKSPNPAFNEIDIPLVGSFVLSNKKGKEAWIEPITDGRDYSFVVRSGKLPSNALKSTMNRAGGICLFSGTPIPFKSIRDAGKSGKINFKLMAIVAEGKGGRVYLSPTHLMEGIAQNINQPAMPEVSLPVKGLGFRIQEYGMKSWKELYTNRQLVTLSVFSELVHEVHNKLLQQSNKLNVKNSKYYADAIALYLAFTVSKTANRSNSLSPWMPSVQCPGHLFRRHAISMNWDFSEANILTGPSGSFLSMLKNTVAGLEIMNKSVSIGYAFQEDAKSMMQNNVMNSVISSDPPYFDNIGYADLSDFFYYWLRISLKQFYPELTSTLITPKYDELIADPGRHNDKKGAENFFLSGMTEAMKKMAKNCHPSFPISIYYAFKQSETGEKGTTSTGWETFLEAMISSGLEITGTWPIRTERENRTRGQESNALASSIVLISKKRDQNADTISRRQFQRELRNDMPEALETIIGGSAGQSPIAPVDLAQAAIGPGMAIFSQYEAVLNQDGTNMSVHDALVLINREITEYLNPDSGAFDGDTLFCSSWFDQYGWSTGGFGEADTLARAKGTTVDGVQQAGVIESGGGKVRLLKWVEYPADWSPEKDNRTPVWEATHQLIRALNQQGESATGALLARMPERGESIRQLAYHLYTLCERKGWAEDARAYNELIGTWHAIVAASLEAGVRGEQNDIFS